MKYLEYLLEMGNYEEAARQCPRILGKNKESWEEQTWKFQKLRQLKVIFITSVCIYNVVWLVCTWFLDVYWLVQNMISVTIIINWKGYWITDF